MSAVQELIRRLNESPVTAAEWQDRAGGCFAIVATLPDGRELTITDREDVFGVSDYTSDYEVFGFYVAVYRVDADGDIDPDMDGKDYLYCTNEADGIAECMAGDSVKVINLATEIDHVMEAVTEFVAGLQDN